MQSCWNLVGLLDIGKFVWTVKWRHDDVVKWFFMIFLKCCTFKSSIANWTWFNLNCYYIYARLSKFLWIHNKISNSVEKFEKCIDETALHLCTNAIIICLVQKWHFISADFVMFLKSNCNETFSDERYWCNDHDKTRMSLWHHHKSRDVILKVFYFKHLKIYNKSATRDCRFLFTGFGRDKLGLHLVSCAWPIMTSTSGRNRKCPLIKKRQQLYEAVSTMLVSGKGGQFKRNINDVTKCNSAL